jgi:hypothetical protein
MRGRGRFATPFRLHRLGASYQYEEPRQVRAQTSGSLGILRLDEQSQMHSQKQGSEVHLIFLRLRPFPRCSGNFNLSLGLRCVFRRRISEPFGITPCAFPACSQAYLADSGQFWPIVRKICLERDSPSPDERGYDAKRRHLHTSSERFGEPNGHARAQRRQQFLRRYLGRTLQKGIRRDPRPHSKNVPLSQTLD